jgi:CBS domain-containing protein
MMTTARDVMTADAQCVKEDQTLAEAVHWVSADADIDDVLAIMAEHQVKRIPVVEDHRLVGMISETDLTKKVDSHRLADVVTYVYA